MKDDLFDLLVCPIDHQPLHKEDAGLVCSRCDRRYPIVDGIPMMIPDDEAGEVHGDTSAEEC